MDAAAVAPAPPPPGGGAPRASVRALLLLAVAAGAAYVALAAAAPAAGLDLPDSVKVGVPFLAVPFLGLRRLGQRSDLGKLDRTFFLSMAAYTPYAVWAALAAQSAAWFYGPVAREVTAFPLVLGWCADTFFHVGAVDYVTKRFVQHEAEPLLGPSRALLLQVGAWSAGHVVEWGWLRLILGDGGAAVYLVSAGFVTGLAYMRWRNVAGLWVGHFLVNVAAAAAAVALYG